MKSESLLLRGTRTQNSVHVREELVLVETARSIEQFSSCETHEQDDSHLVLAWPSYSSRGVVEDEEICICHDIVWEASEKEELPWAIESWPPRQFPQPSEPNLQGSLRCRRPNHRKTKHPRKRLETLLELMKQHQHLQRSQNRKKMEKAQAGPAVVISFFFHPPSSRVAFSCVL